jgi:hypothetical protein
MIDTAEFAYAFWMFIAFWVVIIVSYAVYTGRRRR